MISLDLLSRIVVDSFAISKTRQVIKRKVQLSESKSRPATVNSQGTTTPLVQVELVVLVERKETQIKMMMMNI